MAKSTLRKKPASRKNKSRSPQPAATQGRAAMRNDFLGMHLVASDDARDDAPTERQMEIYEFIREKIHSRGYGPTVREIGAAFKIRSPNGVVCHLKALERRVSFPAARTCHGPSSS